MFQIWTGVLHSEFWFFFPLNKKGRLAGSSMPELCDVLGSIPAFKIVMEIKWNLCLGPWKAIASLSRQYCPIGLIGLFSLALVAFWWEDMLKALNRSQGSFSAKEPVFLLLHDIFLCEPCFKFLGRKFLQHPVSGPARMVPPNSGLESRHC